jgi:hypothetical protein
MDNKEIENVVEICQAYKVGFDAGRMNLSTVYNDYKKETEQYYAWILGHNVGVQAELMDLDEGWIN